MRGRTTLAALALLAAPVEASAVDAATLERRDCPFAEDFPTHIAACSRFTRADGGTVIAFDVAVLTPSTRRSVGHVVYLPGGPGEAPVGKQGLFADLLTPFADRTLVLFNPRGTEGTRPRLTCDFGALVLEQDFGDARALSRLRDCLRRFERDGIDPALFTSLDIAEDVDALVRALGIARAGVYGISYGTESGLHLLAMAPRWLGFAILDSVSVPGLSGIRDELDARDRFLAALDLSCFAAGQCSPIARGDAATLAEWAAQFDAEPLVFHIREDHEWAFDGADILDYLAQLGAYPDGLDIAGLMVDLIQTSRLRALGWISEDVTSNIEFTAENLPLMLQAYADTFDEADVATIAGATDYPRDREGAEAQLDFQRLWRGDTPREAVFLTGERRPAGVPVLMLSGGVDAFTPAEWAAAVHGRFSGLDHFLFPLLGHANSVVPTAPLRDPALTAQTRCAGAAMRAFLNPTLTLDADCRRYRIGEEE